VCTEWPRYAKNGRLKHFCCPCDAVVDEWRQAVASAKARGYKSVANTPEYKRREREAEAQKKGLSIAAYVPNCEQRRIAAMKRVEQASDKLRLKFAKDWMKPFRVQFEADKYKFDADHRERRKSSFRERYSKSAESQRARVAAYKLAHSDLNNEWSRTRNERVVMQSDGTLTAAVISQLKAGAVECAYCGVSLEAVEKQTDHIAPICYGGEHSVRNVVICCAPCNGRKARLMPLEWLERSPVQHRARIEALYRARSIGDEGKPEGVDLDLCNVFNGSL